jgi:AmpD protein
VSAHFLIRRDGELLQFVSANARAWHAGVSQFAGRERCNDFSIGIELEGSDFVPFETAQYQSLAALTLALQRRYRLACVAGHEHIAPGRKTDPGPCFDWHAYQKLCSAEMESSGLSFTMLA